MANEVPGHYVLPLEILSYVFMFAVLFALLVKTLRTVRNGGDEKAGMALSFSLYAWSVSTMFLGEYWIYITAWFLGFLTLPLMQRSVRKEAGAQ